MRSITGFGKTVTNWRLISDNVKPHLTEMPQVQPIAAELEALIGEIQTLDNEQEITRGRLRELTRRRREAEKRGENLRRRIAAHLRGTFGFTSEQLIQFGVNPRPTATRRASRKPDEAKAPAESPAPPKP
jgi:hypothetical protein